MINDFYTIKEFAKEMKVSEKTIRRMIEIGTLNAFRVGPSQHSPYRIPGIEASRLSEKNYFEKKMKKQGEI